MLTLILGRAGSGKTAAVLNRIADAVREKTPGSILIVPEQYSHDAERELAALAPSDASLYAEVLSFSRLANRVFSEVGGLAEKTMDKGGRTLAMSRAVSETASLLKVYSFGGNKAEFLAKLISAYDELRSARTMTSALADAADRAPEELGKKLGDLTLIFEAYERIKATSGLDARDRLDRLAERIGESTIGASGKIYIDGFTDFTAQETKVIDELLRKGADITVTLSCDRLDSDNAMFALPAQTARGLMALSSERKTGLSIEYMTNENSARPAELRYLERAIWDYTAAPFTGECERISVSACDSITRECEMAAAETVRLVQSGARFRDIAIVSPDWGKYASTARGIFLKYGVPVNTADKADILAKPVMAFVTSALDIITGGWTYNDVMRYVKTGLSGITDEESDILENYVLKWNIHGYGFWTREKGWNMHPEGYSESLSEEDAALLASINRARETVSAPLAELRAALQRAGTAAEKAGAIYDFLERTELYAKLDEKVKALTAAGRLQLAGEYAQLWEILMSALSQFADILGDTDISNDELTALLKLLLGQYEIGTIPSSVDSVGVGDMARMRGRGVKHLILLGATDTALPSFPTDNGIFSDDERTELRALGVELPEPDSDTLAREMGLIYASLTMPSETLTITYPTYARRSYIVTRLEKLFGLRERAFTSEVYTYSKAALFELGLSGGPNDRFAGLAEAYFLDKSDLSARYSAIKDAVNTRRGRLSRESADKLYGKNITLSASRIDKFYACRYSFFLQYGLRLKSRRRAELDAPENGTFMHYILERTAGEAEKRGGYKHIDDAELKSLARVYAAEYADKKLGGLEDKTGRFRYLFARLSDDAQRVAAGMADELRQSEFRALDFELKFAFDGELPPVTIPTETGDVRVNGIVDRVDGWVHNGRLYLRVVDYKTGKKSFKLSDIWYGMGMQMLIYLFSLAKDGEARYGREIVPAGVLYAPARDPITDAPHDLDDDTLYRERLKGVKRSGLLLDDPEVIAAMDTTGGGGYLPVKFKKDGTLSGDSLASLEHLGALGRHIDRLMAEMGKELRAGSIKADPYYRGEMDNACMYCDYYDACRFSDGTGDDRRRNLSSLASPEVWARLEEEKYG